jgi:hypothetical protein
VLAKRIESQFNGGATAVDAATEEAQLKQANALYSLLSDRYKTKV